MMKTFIALLLCLSSCFSILGNCAPEENKFTIEMAVQSALKLNERAATADERTKAAAARVLKARSFFLPSINTQGTYTRRPYSITTTINGEELVIQRLNGLGGNINLNLTILDPRAFPAYNQVLLENKAEKNSAAESKRALAFEVCNAYLTTLGNEQMLKAAQQRLDLAGKNLDASKARYEAQLVSINDVTRNELEFAIAEQNITRAKGDFDTAELQLEYLVGAPIKGELENPNKLLAEAQSPPQSADVLIPLAQKYRLDLKSLEWHAKAQHAAANEPVMRWLPNLGFNAQYKITNEAGFSGKNTTWSAGLTMNWAIFDGFARMGDYKEKKALAKIADLDLKSAVRKLDVQVRNALVSLDNQQASLKKAGVALDVAKKNANETSELYRQGLTGALQAADANVRLYEAEVEYIRERFGLAVAFLNLRFALGQDPL